MAHSDAAQKRWTEATAAQRLMIGMSDRPGQFRQDPMMALINQAHRATQSSHDGIDYMSTPF
ncbi:hypothetical protein [Mycobacterium terramassiliense]|uniref:Uncharacterized protein n=1 Tax=Mycobacterium terramassiliense TaxID=1841859 RepID=A0A2U3NEP4_9MYCO|nr:hypothetical protein [Mycobacterium terramassiliense]SPM29953.1 hypothetical protein MTAB308_3451 [Mycobacterium terramassiliense]